MALNKWRQFKKKIKTKQENKTCWYEAGFSSCRGLTNSLLGLISPQCLLWEASWLLFPKGCHPQVPCLYKYCWNSSYLGNEKSQYRVFNKSKRALLVLLPTRTLSAPACNSPAPFLPQNLQWARDVLLGSTVPWQQLKHMPAQGLFCERNKTNFFNVSLFHW